MARKKNDGGGGGRVVQFPSADTPITATARLRCWFKRIEWAWKSLLLVFAILAAGWGAARWQSSAVRSAEDSIRQMQERLIRVETTQGEMRDDLKLIKRKLIGQ